MTRKDDKKKGAKRAEARKSGGKSPAKAAPAQARSRKRAPQAVGAEPARPEKSKRRRKHGKRRPAVVASPPVAEKARPSSASAPSVPPEHNELELEMNDANVASEEVPELGLGSRMVPPTLVFHEASDSSPPSSRQSSGDVAEQIRALEARLDGMMRNGVPAPEPSDESDQTEAVSAPPAATISESPYFEQQWGRTGLRSRSEEVDDFGLDPEYEKKARRLAEFLYKRYFRIKTEGVQNLPADGRCIVVANHSGTLPLDGMMLRTAVRLEHAAARELRWLAEDFLFYLPFAGVFLNRVGAVRACPENAERLLSKEALVAVFPEGVHGIKKLFSERYRLQRFGRGGYIRLALRMRAPVVPCAIVGAEETNPLIYRLESIASLVGLPYIPVTPTFPLLGPLGLLPAPTRWRIKFGEPISVDSYGPEAADDQLLVGRLSDRVRGSIQAMLDTNLRERQSVWFG